MKEINYLQYLHYLDVLGIHKATFTKEDLQASFRNLTEKGDRRSTTEMEEIIQAYSKLNDFLNGEVSLQGYYYTENDLNNYKNYLIVMHKYIIGDPEIYPFVTGTLLNQYLSINAEILLLDKYQISSSYDYNYDWSWVFKKSTSIKKARINFFKNFTEAYFRANCINSKDFVNLIDYECSFADLEKQLQRLPQKYNIKPKYNLEQKYKQLIDNAFCKFESCNNSLKRPVERIKGQTLTKLLNATEDQINDIIVAGRQQLEDAFKFYFEKLEGFNAIKSFINGEDVDDPTIQQLNVLYVRYYEQFQRGNIFDASECLDVLDSLVQEYQASKKILNQRNDLFMTITNNYLSCIQKIDNIANDDKLVKLREMTNLYQEIIDSFKKYSLTDDIVARLQQLDFTNYDVCQKLLRDWQEGSRKERCENGNLYILHNIFITGLNDGLPHLCQIESINQGGQYTITGLGRSTMFKIENFDQDGPNTPGLIDLDCLVKCRIGEVNQGDRCAIPRLSNYYTVTSRAIDEEQFNKYYISIDEFFRKAALIGEESVAYPHVIYLCGYKNAFLTLDTRKNILDFVHGSRATLPVYNYKSMNKFGQDRKKIKEKIIQDFGSQMNKDNQEKDNNKTKCRAMIVNHS